MEVMPIRATILLALCMACSTTDPIPEPAPSHPASSSAAVPVLAGPSDLLATHDPLPQLSTRPAPDAMTGHDHEAMQREPSASDHDHGAMAPGHEGAKTEPEGNDHGGRMNSAEPTSPPAGDPDEHAGHETAEVVYACPMHPEQRSDEPADCPICGMEMKPIEVEP